MQYKSYISLRHQNWRAFRAILWLLNRRNELQRLIKWAKKRKFAGPLRTYQGRLDHTEVVLARLSMSTPEATRWARRVYFVSNLMSTTPRYPRKGIAAHYRYRQK